MGVCVYIYIDVVNVHLSDVWCEGMLKTVLRTVYTSWNAYDINNFTFDVNITWVK